MSRKVSYTQLLGGEPFDYKYGQEEKQAVTVSYLDTAGNPAHGWFAEKYTWNRIETVEDFKKKEPLNSETVKALNGKDWVLRFAETSYDCNAVIGGTGVTVGRYNYCITEVTEVTILRLKFETDGVVYNLGVVDNFQSGDLNPDGETVSAIIRFFRKIGNWIAEHWNIVLIAAIVFIAVIIGLKLLSLVWSN